MVATVKKVLVKDAEVGKTYLTPKDNQVVVLKKNSLGQAVVRLIVKTAKSEHVEKKILGPSVELRHIS